MRLVATVLIGYCAALSAQQSADDLRLSVRSNLVFLPTRVQNKKGETIYGLKPEQFVVEDNGARQSVRIDEDPESAGLSLVVLVQCSRSAETEFVKLKGLGAMVEAIAGDDPHEVAVVSFGAGPYVLSDFSTNTQAAELALSKLRPCSDYHAATIDAVYYAINMLNRRQTHYRRAILLISETRDQGSHARLQDVVAQLGITDTVIYSVAFSPTRDEILDGLRYGDHPPPPPKLAPGDAEPPDIAATYRDHPSLLERALPPQLLIIINALRRNSASELASLSGGEYLNFTTQRGFEDGLQRISNRIHDYYLVSFQPPASAEFGLHTLKVRVVGFPDAVIQARKSYWSGILEGAGSKQF